MSRKAGPFHIKSEDTVFAGNWIQAKRLVVTKSSGNVNKEVEETWEVVKRSKAADASVHGVYIVPLVKSKAEGLQIVLVKEYRLAVEEFVLQLPGGFVKSGETVVESALRELWEETGYRGRVLKESPGIATEGASVMDSRLKIVTVLIDGDEECNRNCKQNLPVDELEEIQVLRFPLKTLDQELEAFAAAGGLVMAELHMLTVSFGLMKMGLD